MKDNLYLFENVLISSKGNELLSNEDYQKCIHMNLEELIQFLKSAGYHVDHYNFHHIQSIDQWKQDEDQKLAELYRENNCGEFLEIFELETTGIPLEEILIRIHQYGQDHGDAAKVFARIFIDELMILSKIRNRTVEANIAQLAYGNIESEDLETIFSKPDQLLFTVQKVYGSAFMEIDSDEDMTEFSLVMQHAFRIVLSEQLSTYYFSTIGKDGLIAYLYAKKSELFNLRMLLKAKNYYISEERQRSLLRRAYV